MSEPEAIAAARRGGGGGTTVMLVEGSTFCVSDVGGDMRPDRPQGLFVRDTRVLSRWELTIDGVVPEVLCVQRGDPYTARFIIRGRAPAGAADSALLIVRSRYIGDGMREDVSVRNTGAHPISCVLSLAVAADFADLFEVKDGRTPPDPTGHGEVHGDSLRLSRRRGSVTHGTAVRADGEPVVTPAAMTWQVQVPGRGEWTTSIEAVPVTDGTLMALQHPRGTAVEHAAPAVRLRQWRERTPQLRTRDEDLAAVLRRSVEDLGALRIFDPAHPERAVVAAGAPWYMALFGRDSLLTSWMLLPVDAGLAVGTLQTLADHQGRAIDLTSEEEPGRILHEIRFGPVTDFAVGGRSVYYGTADATPLFVMLLGEVRRWGYDNDLIESLLSHADRALDWMQTHGDADGDGFVEYERKTEAGLVSQGWKDSWDGVNFADGRVAEAPIALAEVQGYCYAAYVARAHFAQEAGDEAVAHRWRDKAAELKHDFNERFWLPERGWFAVGLDRDKQPIDALTSNIGHCLWTGIIDEDLAEAVADHLLSEDMFTGWGIRTLARSMGAYNPMSYHNGSVWPHDSALCASGLMRYGFVQHAQRIAEAVLDAATHFEHRLPELFCGFDRSEFDAPVPYPASCSPQAWAAAAPVLLLRTLLRFDPKAPANQVWCAPEFPARYLPLRFAGLRLAGAQLTIDVPEPGRCTIDGLHGSGIELLPTPRSPSGDRA